MNAGDSGDCDQTEFRLTLTPEIQVVLVLWVAGWSAECMIYFFFIHSSRTEHHAAIT